MATPNVTWLKTSGGSIPNEAIRAGYEGDGQGLYIARANTKYGLTPGKCGSYLKEAIIPLENDDAYSISNYEVLVQSPSEKGFYKWKDFSLDIPANAVKTSDLHGVGRVTLGSDGGVQVGRIYLPDKSCHVFYKGKGTHVTADFEVLCKEI